MSGINVGTTLAAGAKGAAMGAALGPIGAAAGGALGVALELAPQLSRWLVGDDGSTAVQVVDAVQRITGSTDPVAQTAAVADPGIAADLRIRLAEIAADREHAKEQAWLAEVKAVVSDRDSARKMGVGLATSGSAMAWGAIVVSVLIVLAFFAMVATVIFVPVALTANQAAILNVLMGTVVAGFSSVSNYWLGSSANSAHSTKLLAQSVPASLLPVPATTTPASPLPLPPATPPAQPLTPVTPEWHPGEPIVLRPEPETPAVPALVASRFLPLFAFVAAREGGWSDDPDDPGGPTMHGVTLATFRDWRHDLSASKDDLRAITDDEVREIARAKYWNTCRCDDLPPGVDLSVFDMAYNAGPKRSVMLLQRVLHVTEDGAVGPITMAAVRQRPADTVIEGLYDAHEAYYRSLSGFRKYGNGWLSRTAMRRTMALREAKAALGVAEGVTA